MKIGKHRNINELDIDLLYMILIQQIKLLCTGQQKEDILKSLNSLSKLDDLLVILIKF